MTKINGLGAVLAACAALTLAGCAANRSMPLANDGDVLKPSEPIVLMTVTLRNDYRPSFTPKMLSVGIASNAAESKRRIAFQVDDKARYEDRGRPDNVYYVRMALEPGVYRLSQLQSHAIFFPLIAHFVTFIEHDFTVPPTGVIYLGNIHANVRSREKGDPPAGGAASVIAQEVSGAHSGTFDVVISDQSERDLAEFRNRFPALKNVQVQKAILPPYDRAKVKRAWEGGDVDPSPATAEASGTATVQSAPQPAVQPAKRAPASRKRQAARQ